MSTSHNPASAVLPLRQALTRSVSEECGGPRAVRFDPDARAFEAFAFGSTFGIDLSGTGLLDPVEATSLDGALAEVTERHHSLDRGDRLGVREIGEGVDLLHVYAVRRTSTPKFYRPAHDNPYARTALSYKCRLEHICTVDLRVLSGDHVDLIGNPSLDEMRRQAHRERQRLRPEGARA